MKIVNFEIVEEEYQGHKYQSIYLVTDKGIKIRLGTIKGSDNLYIVTAQKKEYK